MIRKPVILAALALAVAAPAAAAAILPVGPITVRLGKDYAAITRGGCATSITNKEALRIVCAAGQAGHVRYGLARDGQAPVIVRHRGSVRITRAHRNGHWRVVVYFGAGTATVRSVVSYQGAVR